MQLGLACQPWAISDDPRGMCTLGCELLSRGLVSKRRTIRYTRMMQIPSASRPWSAVDRIMNVCLTAMILRIDYAHHSPWCSFFLSACGFSLRTTVKWLLYLCASLTLYEANARCMQYRSFIQSSTRDVPLIAAVCLEAAGIKRRTIWSGRSEPRSTAPRYPSRYCGWMCFGC